MKHLSKIHGKTTEKNDPVSIAHRRYFVKNNQPKIKARNEARKKHNRRTAQEMERDQIVSSLTLVSLPLLWEVLRV